MYKLSCQGTQAKVALRKESVDRNLMFSMYGVMPVSVALRKESVDRNTTLDNIFELLPKSLSVRRAWIEIVMPLFSVLRTRVALRKESVDRNI